MNRSAQAHRGAPATSPSSTRCSASAAAASRIAYPEIAEMQARAIFEAARRGQQEPSKPVGLPSDGPAGRHQGRVRPGQGAHRRTAQRSRRKPAKFVYQVGTMIELPRAPLMAGEIAETAEFFSFGTNDLTQTTFGISRDDAAFLDLPPAGILEIDPFASVDRDGVGELVKIGVQRGRKTRPNLKVGICGEHGGDPATGGVLSPDRAQLRLLLALSRADRAPSPPRKPAPANRWPKPGHRSQPSSLEGRRARACPAFAEVSAAGPSP